MIPSRIRAMDLGVRSPQLHCQHRPQPLSVLGESPLLLGPWLLESELGGSEVEFSAI